MLTLFLDLIDDVSDKKLFELIYSNHQRQMFYIAFDILKDRQFAEDALQNTFLRIATNIKVLRNLNETETKYYLYISAKNAAIDINKKLNKTKIVNIDDFYNLSDKSATDTIEEFEGNDYIVWLLTKLPDKYTDVLYLRYVTGLSDIEIARILNRKINTVRQQISRGKTKFIELYEKENTN